MGYHVVQRLIWTWKADIYFVCLIVILVILSCAKSISFTFEGIDGCCLYCLLLIGTMFQWSTTLCVKLFFLMFNCGHVASEFSCYGLSGLWFLPSSKKGYLCPRHWVLSLSWTPGSCHLEGVCRPKWAGQANLSSRFLYGRSFILETIFVALLCTFSSLVMSWLRNGFHTQFAYSRWGLTNGFVYIYSKQNISSSMRKCPPLDPLFCLLCWQPPKHVCCTSVMGQIWHQDPSRQPLLPHLSSLDVVPSGILYGLVPSWFP